MVKIKTKSIKIPEKSSWLKRKPRPSVKKCIKEAIKSQPMPANLQDFMKDKKDTAMDFTISVKPGVDFPRNLADLVRNALLEADKDKVAEYIEWLLESKNLPDEFFLSVFTQENRKLLAMLLKGKIKKRRGFKQEQGFSDLLIWMHYKRLRENGNTWTHAIKKTAEDLEAAKNLPKSDLWRQVAVSRRWNDNNIEENVKEIVSKMGKIYELTPP